MLRKKCFLATRNGRVCADQRHDVRSVVACDDEARLACAACDFYIGDSLPRLDEEIARKLIDSLANAHTRDKYYTSD